MEEVVGVVLEEEVVVVEDVVVVGWYLGIFGKAKLPYK